MKAKVYEVTESKNGKDYQSFKVSWKDTDGRRRQRRFQNRAEAETFASLRDIESLNAKVDHTPRLTTLTPEQIRDAENAFTILGDSGTLTAAAEAYSKPRTVAELTLRDACDRFLDVKEREGLRPRSVNFLKSLLRKFVKGREETIVSTIGERDCVKWIQEGRAPKSRRERHFAIKGLFAWIEGLRNEDGAPYLTRHPLTNVKPPKLATRDPEALTASEAKRLMESANNYRKGEWVPYFALALFCALRPSEISDLSNGVGWDAVNLKTRRIRLTANKVSGRRVVEIPKNAAQWLAPFKDAGSPIQPPGLAKNLRAIREAAGLKRWPRDVMRHTGISMRLAAGHPAAEVADWAGNSVKIVKAHYDALIADPEEAKTFYAIHPPKSAKIVKFPKRITSNG